MIPVGKWVDRKFAFGQPLWMVPNFLVRLYGAAPRIDELSSGLSHDLLTRKIDGKWSIQEQIGHLLVLEELWFGRIEDFVAGLPTMRAADMQNVRTSESNFNAWEIEKLCRAFRDARAEFIGKLEAMDEAMLLRRSIHPRLQQEITLVDSMWFVAEHDDHHIAKMREIRRAVT